ncbi:ATP-binding cassette glutathione S-conjugate transporter ycf1 [Saitoella coloradoensis]
MDFTATGGLQTVMKHGKHHDAVRRVAFCRNSEGWGPISLVRMDFTPCFYEGILISAVNLFILTFGAYRLLQLLRRSAVPVKKGWHYSAKVILAHAIVVVQVVLSVLYALRIEAFWDDVRFWSAMLGALATTAALAIHVLEHARARVASAVLLFFWLGRIVVDALKLRHLVIMDVQRSWMPYFITYVIGFGLEVFLFGLESFIPKDNLDYHLVDEDEDPSPLVYANIFSKITFSWMTPMMKKGYNTFLTENDLWTTRKEDSTEYLAGRLEYYWDKELLKEKVNLWRVLFKAYGGPYAAAAFFKLAQDVLAFTQPQLLRLLISFVNTYTSDHPDSYVKGFAIAGSMFAVSLIQTMFLHQYFQRAFETGMRTRVGLISAIYKKALVLSNDGRATKSTGDIVNLMSVDTQRLGDLCQNGQIVWSAPFQITLCLISLYNLVGFSMFAGLAVMIIMIPLNAWLARLMKRMQKEQMHNKDSRTRLMTEILNNIKSIKLYAWEPAFMQKLREVRNDRELKNLKKIGVINACSNFTWACAPFLVSCSTFAVFVLTQSKPLTTDIVFPALALFNLLTFPLAILPQVITSIVEAGVAVDRLEDFLLAEEVQPDAVRREPTNTKMGGETIRVEDATFQWNAGMDEPTLKDVDFVARKGELSCIVGRVGAGKTSFIESLLGNLHKVQGEVIVRGRVAYVAQQPWIMNGSVKANILFGHKYDPEFYQKAIEACALVKDFESLPDGDRTEVGEKGISLSGGQKARLSLARAVYTRADVYLLDDPLSAVDAHVGRHLIDNVLGPKGLLATKTRVLATNAIPVLSQADTITMIREGKIVESGTYEDVMAAKSALAALITEFGKKAHEVQEDEDSGSETVAAAESDGSDPAGVSLKDRNRRDTGATLRRASTASFSKPRGRVVDEEANKVTAQAREFSEQGKVKWDVYKEYAKSCSSYGVFFYFLFLLASQAGSVAGNVWLKNWAEVNSGQGSNKGFGMYLAVYFGLGVGSSGLTVVSTLILWILCGIRSATKLHDDMAYQVIMKSPMQFFETTPIGRILNRFSNDVYKIDEVLMRTFGMFFRTTVQVLFVIGVITRATPPFLAIMIPLSGVYLYVQRFYLRTSRELKRLDSTTRSPIYAHFQESLGGISTIRAYNQQTRFEFENSFRIDMNQRAYFPSISANRWLAVRLEFIGSIIILSAATLSVVTLITSGISAGLVGLAMSYALQTTQSLNWIVRQTVEVETNIVSVERVLEYSRLPSEAPRVIEENRPSPSWPSKGDLVFHKYSARYRDGLPLVLKDINVAIKAREKIGIVGRTGAGKSSLTLALFRLIEAADGHISLDGVNTSNVGLYDLRSRLAIIPQDSQAFEGTIRDNLDPAGVHDDAALWEVLEHSHLKDAVAQMPGKLGATVNEGGSNLSSGQRQLMCLARALLTPSKVLVLDEATAAVDVETDQLLQQTIRREFKDRTILTIAHRINTIMDSDKILVLSAGRVAEFDTPANLLENKDSLFYALVEEAGLGGKK